MDAEKWFVLVILVLVSVVMGWKTMETWKNVACIDACAPEYITQSTVADLTTCIKACKVP